MEWERWVASEREVGRTSGGGKTECQREASQGELGVTRSPVSRSLEASYHFQGGEGSVRGGEVSFTPVYSILGRSLVLT